MTKHFDVLIIGGGVIGLSAALGMAKRRYSAAVIDANHFNPNTQKVDARVYAINQASTCLLQQLGVWDKLNAARCSPYQYMHVWDSKTQALIHFDSRLIAANALGTIIEESVLREALLHELMDYPDVEFFAGQTINAIKTAPLEIASTQQSWRGGLLIIADGANSPTRRLLNCPLTSWPYHQQAIVARVKTEKPHQQTAWQVFTANGPLAFLPLAELNQCSIVWSTSSQQANYLMALPNEAFNQQLAQAFEHKLGQVELIDSRHQFPLQMRHAKTYVGDNWLLMGDAAHTIHPLAGLGLNVGLADLACWLKQVDQQQRLGRRALLAYQRERKQAVWQIIALMDGLKLVFANPLPPIQLLRKFGLKLCNQSSSLKRLFIEHAAG